MTTSQLLSDSRTYASSSPSGEIAGPCSCTPGNGYYVLYIHPETYRLFGYQYANGYRPLLDAMGLAESRDVFGPLWRLITRYQEVDGLLFPSAFRTSPEAGERIVGNHVILNIDVSTPFEHDKAERPEGSEIYAGPLQTD